MDRRKFLKLSAAGAAASSSMTMPALMSSARADARSESLLIVSESGPNNLDIHGVGTNVPGYEASWNCYDRLISHEMKSGPNGVPYYDRDKFKPELAEDMNVGDMSATFKLKKNATFQDGTPVTAKDVKWSLDRAVSVGGFPTFQMKAGSLEKPEQFVVVDDNTVRVDFLRKDKLTIPDLAVIVPCVINSELVKKNATAADPWGLEYTKQNTAGSGAYKVTKWTPGTEVIFERNDAWKGGELPKVRADHLAHGAVRRQPPRAARARRCRHFLRSAQQGLRRTEGERQARHRVDAVFQRHAIHRHERHQAAFRQSEGAPGRRLRAALPEDHGRRAVRSRQTDVRRAGRCTDASRVAATAEIQHRYCEGPARCWRKPAIPTASRRLCRSTSASLASTSRSACWCRKACSRSASSTTINKVPGANWRTELNKKEMPLFTNVFSGWLDYPEYFFFWCYDGQNSVFNTMSYKNPEMDKLIAGARAAAAAGNTGEYDKDVRGFVDLAFTDVPRIPLFQPYVNVAMQKNVSGYQYWFHRRLDYRALVKA